MKRLSRTLTASIMAAALITVPVMAAPSEMDSLEAQKKEAMSSVNALQNQLADVMGQINALEVSLIEKGEEIQQAQADLAAAQEKEQQQYADMKLRIKYMYEEGGISALDKVFTSGSITEILNRAQYMQDVHSYDQQMLQEYIDTKNEIADLKSHLETERQGLEQLDKELEEKCAALNDTISSQQELVANLDEQLQQAVIAEQQRAAEAAAQAAQKSSSNTKPSGQSNHQSTTQPTQNPSQTPPSTPDPTPAPSPQPTPDPTPTPVPTPDPVPEATPTPTPEPAPSIGGNYSAAATIVSAAWSQIGVPYEWGGTRPNVGLDCSGLTQYCHRVAGISIPRTSGEQLAAGKRVTNPEPGDVCWTPGHVAIYIGNGQMIEAPDVGQTVKVSRVRASVYLRFW